MSATTCSGFWLCWKYFDGRSYYHHISSLLFSQHNGVFSPSPLLIVIFWSFIWFLLMDDCNHSLVSLISLEVLFWDIILYLYWYYNHLFHLKYSADKSNSAFFFFIANYQNRANIWKVINSHWIKTIKGEQTLGNLSTRTESRLSQENLFWQVINSYWIKNIKAHATNLSPTVLIGQFWYHKTIGISLS